jgi:hypothetical protein
MFCVLNGKEFTMEAFENAGCGEFAKLNCKQP